MNPNGQIYFGPEDEIPEADKERLSDAHAAFLLRAAAEEFEDRVDRLRKAKTLQDPLAIMRITTPVAEAREIPSDL